MEKTCKDCWDDFETDDESDALLIGYGLCSNGLVGIKSKDKKLIVMRGHDCITFLLGSKEYYKEYFDANPGTYWYSPGWIETGTQPGKERYENTMKDYIEKYGEDNAEYLMKMEQGWIDEYSTAAYVDLGFNNSEKYKGYTKKCANWLNWKYDELNGDPGLIQRFVNGEWNNKEFLIVEPGQEIIPSYDDRIIDVKESE